MPSIMPSKDPAAIEPYFIVWCDRDNTNTGAPADDGELQGATIATATWTVLAGITKVLDVITSVTINGIAYSASTVCTIWLSGGTAGTDYTLACKITTSDGRTLNHSIIVPVETH